VTDLDTLSAEHVAALVAPIIDRIRLGISKQTAAGLAHLIGSLGLDRQAAATLANLRNVGPGTTITRDGIRAVYTYTPTGTVDAGIALLCTAGVLDEFAPDRFVITHGGAQLQAEIAARTAELLAEAWRNQEDRVTALALLAGRALDAGRSDGGVAFGIMAPAGQPADTPVEVLLSERLTGLRFHRFDAHIAAWRAAGLSVETIKELKAGPERTVIEVETNRRAATPYAVLDAVERLELVAGLGALPA
jgi:hypothetical protein